MDDLLNWVTVALGVVDLLLIPPMAALVLLTKKNNPASTVAWLLAVVIVPYFGAVLFLLFGINRVERRAEHKLRATRAIERHMPELSQYQLIPRESEQPELERLSRLAGRIAGTVPTFGNQVELSPETSHALELIEQAIHSARETLHLEYYIWQPDRVGTRLRDLLIEKAREGVAVRFLYDKIGSWWLNRRFLKPMREAGIQVASFLPGPTLRERWSWNLCSHRKIVIVDGRVGFTGGMNIGDEYLGRNPQFGYWRDTHLRLIGPTVLQLQQVFAEDWYYATGEELTGPAFFPEPDDSGDVRAQVLSDGPDNEVNVFHSLLFAAINESRSQITLATSYFVPPYSLVTALESAAHRGVRVRVLVPGRSAYQWTVWAGQSYYDSLLDAGVEIYEYEQGLLHSKTITIDGTWSLVGTPNFDFRSLFLNFEVAVALYDAKLASQLEDQFSADLLRARRIEPPAWTQRRVMEKLRENVCRLLAPVL